MLRMAGAALLLIVAAPASAADWIYADSAADGANISFIDKDAIVPGEAGILRAPMFSLLAEEEEGASAYRFLVEADCTKKLTRLTTAEMFDIEHVSKGVETIASEWEAPASETQGETVLNFICTKGASAKGNPSMGSALPFDSGKALLAEKQKAKVL